MIIGIFLYSFALTALTNIVKRSHQNSKSFYDKKAYLDDIAKEYKINYSLYQKIYRHLYFANLNNKNANNILINDLPITLKNEVIFNMHKDLIKFCPFFMDLYDKEFILKILMCLKPTTSQTNEALIHQGDFVEEVIFIKSGLLQLDTVVYIQTDLKKSKDTIYTVNHLKTFKSFKSLKENMYSKTLVSDLKAKKPTKTSKDFNLSPSHYFNDEKNKQLNSNFSLSLVDMNKISNLEKMNSIKLPGNDKDDEELRNVISNNTQHIENVSFSKAFIFKLKIAKMRRNEYFGDTLIIDNKRSIFTLKTKSKSTELFLMNKFDLLQLLKEFPRIFKNIYIKSNQNMEKISDILKIAIKIAENKIEKDFKNKSIYCVDFDNLKNNIISTKQIYNYLMVNKLSDLNFEFFNNSLFSDSLLSGNVNDINYTLKEVEKPNVEKVKDDDKEINDYFFSPDNPLKDSFSKHLVDSMKINILDSPQNAIGKVKHNSQTSIYDKTLTNQISENRSNRSIHKYSALDKDDCNINNISQGFTNQISNASSRNILNILAKKESKKTLVNNNIFKISSKIKNSLNENYKPYQGSGQNSLNNSNNINITYFTICDTSFEDYKLDEFQDKEKCVKIKSNITKKNSLNLKLGSDIFMNHNNKDLSTDNIITNKSISNFIERPSRAKEFLEDGSKIDLKLDFPFENFENQTSQNKKNCDFLNYKNEHKSNFTSSLNNDYFHQICEFCKIHNKNIMTISKKDFKIYENKIENVSLLTIVSTTADSSSNCTDSGSDIFKDRERHECKKDLNSKIKLIIANEVDFSIFHEYKSSNKTNTQISKEDILRKIKSRNSESSISGENKYNFKVNLNVYNQITNDNSYNLIDKNNSDFSNTYCNNFNNDSFTNVKKSKFNDNANSGSLYTQQVEQINNKLLPSKFGDQNQNLISLSKVQNSKFNNNPEIHNTANSNKHSNKAEKYKEKINDINDNFVLNQIKSDDKISISLINPYKGIKNQFLIRNSNSDNKLTLNYNANSKKPSSLKTQKSNKMLDDDAVNKTKTNYLYDEIFGLHEHNIGEFFDKLIKKNEKKNTYMKYKDSLMKLDKLFESFKKFT